MTLLRRILREKRSRILIVVVGLVLNAIIYGAVVYPLSVRARTAEARAEETARNLRVAELLYAQARETVTSKTSADDALKRFYADVLPANLTGARRITYLRLAQLAEKANLRYERGTVREEHGEDSQLSRLRLNMVLAGSYPDVRRFIYQLETAPEFVVIELVGLAQGQEGAAQLVLNLQVSTYYRIGADGI